MTPRDTRRWSTTEAIAAPIAAAPFPIATALRRTFAKGYGARELRADALAGLVVGIVALRLSMALAIAIGVPPQHGLYACAAPRVLPSSRSRRTPSRC